MFGALLLKQTITALQAHLSQGPTIKNVVTSATQTHTLVASVQAVSVKIIIWNLAPDWYDSERANGLFSKCLRSFLRHNEEKIESICQLSRGWRMKNNFLKDVSVSFPSPRWEGRISDSYGILQMADASNIGATPGPAPRHIPGRWFIDAAQRVNCGAQVSITLLGGFWDTRLQICINKHTNKQTHPYFTHSFAYLCLLTSRLHNAAKIALLSEFNKRDETLTTWLRMFVSAGWESIFESWREFTRDTHCV